MKAFAFKHTGVIGALFVCSCRGSAPPGTKIGLGVCHGAGQSFPLPPCLVGSVGRSRYADRLRLNFFHADNSFTPPTA
jgi:hypothetical protein